MSECYFTVEEAKEILSHKDKFMAYISTGQLLATCREIIRLNEVIEGMKAKELLLDEATLGEYGMLQEYLEEQQMIGNQPDVPGSYLRVTCHKCGTPMVLTRPGKWQCPECE